VTLRRLAEAGWATAEVYDLCWLDCPEPGYLKSVLSARTGVIRVICLCVEHALKLENGAYFSDYEGAPLPAESIAGQWPWQEQELESVA
jgi:hypothetical protein